MPQESQKMLSYNVCVCVLHGCAWRPGVNLWCHSLDITHHSLFETGSFISLKHTKQLYWLNIKIQFSFSYHSSSVRVTNTCGSTKLFWHSFRGSNSYSPVFVSKFFSYWTISQLSCWIDIFKPWLSVENWCDSYSRWREWKKLMRVPKDRMAGMEHL